MDEEKKCEAYKCIGSPNDNLVTLYDTKGQTVTMCNQCVDYYTPQCYFCKRFSQDGDICMFCGKPYCEICAKQWDQELGMKSRVYGDHNLCKSCH